MDFERVLWLVALLGISVFFLVHARRPDVALAPLSPALRDAIVTANNDFGFRLFSLSMPKLPGELMTNTIISPTNLEVELGLVANGARGATRTQIDTALGWQTLAPKQRDSALQALAGDIFAADAHVMVTPINALWVDKSLSIRKGFLKHNAPYFSTKVRTVRFSDANSASIMDRWVSHESHAKIPAIVGRGNFDANTRLFALNALTFQGDWLEKFDPSLTKDAPFSCPGGLTTHVKMMQREGYFHYAEDNIMQVVKLPCGEGKVNMVLLLPRPGQTLDTVRQAAFSTDNWNTLLARLSSHDGLLALPRCKITASISMPFALQSLGMTNVFISGKADLSDMSASPCCLNQLTHQVLFVMAENGDRTAVPVARRDTLTVGAMPHDAPFSMILNRPFLFAYISADGAVLLLGSVTSPV